MSNRYPLGRVADLELTAAPSAAGGLALLWMALSLLGWKGFRLRPAAALTAGCWPLCCTLYSSCGIRPATPAPPGKPAIQ